MHSPQIPAFKLPFPPGISISVAGPHKKARRSLRAGAGASFLDRVLKVRRSVVRFMRSDRERANSTQSLTNNTLTRHHAQGAKEAVRRRAQFPFVIPFAIPEDISKQLGCVRMRTPTRFFSHASKGIYVNSKRIQPTSTNHSIPSTPPAPPAPVEGDEDIEHEHEHEEFDEDDVDDLVISLFAGTMVPPPPEEVVTIAPPTLVIATDEEVVVATATATAVTEETEVRLFALLFVVCVSSASFGRHAHS